MEENVFSVIKIIRYTYFMILEVSTIFEKLLLLDGVYNIYIPINTLL